MAALKNDRDIALQAAPYRSKQAAVTISGTASSFLVSSNTTTILPTSITLTATPSGSVYTSNAVYTWSYALSTAPTTWIQLSSGANLKTQILNNTDSWVANAFVQYRCIVTETLLDTSYAYYTVSYTKEASEPVIVNLLRSNVLVTCDSSGTPISFSNTNQTITVNRGSTALVYSANTTTPNSFSVSYAATNLTASTATGSGTSWTQAPITAIAVDGATIVYAITVYDSATTPAPTVYTRTVVFNKVSNGTIGADGANLYPIANYDFAGASLPSNVTYPGSIASSDSSTTTTIQNTSVDQNLRLTNLSLVPTNSYIISMRVKWISGTWEGVLLYSNPAHSESVSYYKSIPQPTLGVWATINVDMRSLTVGGTEYMTGGNISQLRFDFINDTSSQVAIDYISIGKYGVAEATKSVTLSMYQWATSPPAYSGAFTYTWNTGNISAFPSGWTSAAPDAPGSGYTLYQRNLVLIEASTINTTAANWSSSQLNTIGYRQDGSIGTQGDSYRIAYVVTNGVWATPTTPTAGTGDVAPSSNVVVGGITTTWSKTATATLTDGQYMYQTDGIYSASTTNITWGVPYLSNLKVGSLSAISASLGTVQVASGGALYSGKTSYSDTSNSGFFLGNDAGYAKFRIGNTDNSSFLGYDSSTGVLTLKGGSYLNNSGATLLSPTTVASDIQNSALVPSISAAADTANTAQTTAQAKLSKAGSDILTGPISFNTDAAILVGTTTSGLYLGNTGIVGKKAGVTTFAVDASGNASFGGALNAATGTFNGALTAATGTFNGALNAATGTFSGSLTAGAVNAVNTVNIAGQAVTVSSGSSSYASSTTLSHTHVSSGYSAIITINGIYIRGTGQSSSGGGVFSLEAYLEVRRNGGLIFSMTNPGSYSGITNTRIEFSYTLINSMASGNQTFEIILYDYPVSSSQGTTISRVSSSYRAITVLEIKR